MHDVGVPDDDDDDEIDDDDRLQLLNLHHLSLPALKLLRLENVYVAHELHLDCPSLETLRFRDIAGVTVPTGLGSCRHLTTLKVAAPMGLTDLSTDAAILFVAIESAQAILEVLDISGWTPGMDRVFGLISRLPRLHTLVAQNNGLTAVPTLPANLKSLDLRANEFTEVPEQLESLTQLTRLALSSKKSEANFQIKRSLGPLISMPQLRELTLVLDCEVNNPEYTRWGARSLYYLGLAQHEIARSELRVVLKY